MIARLVELAIARRFFVALLAIAVVCGGLSAQSRLDIEAYPNPVPPMIDVITQPKGWSAEEVERYVTIPLEIALSGMGGLDHVRTQSLFGLSDVKCYFRWGTDYWAARQEVLNRLAQVDMPTGVQPKLSPWNAIGELVRYTVRGPQSLMDRKTTEDWILEPQFRRVNGVVDVVSFGGDTKQYQVGVDPFRLRGHGATLDDLMDAIANANKNVGGQRLTIGEQSYAIRGVGLLANQHDIGDIVIGERGAIPVRIRDIADVQVGPAPRLGIVGQDDDPDVVQGIVLMRYGGQTRPTLEGIHDRLDKIDKLHTLPPEMKVVPYYDRGDLVRVTTHTVTENVIVGIVLVSILLFVFLGRVRGAIIAAINIPLALLVAFSGIVVTNTSANLISLGAIDFGIVVDSTVLMMENVFRHLGKHGHGTVSHRVAAAAREVGSPMLFSTLILVVALLPLFTMTGVAGVIFSPMAYTYAFAITGAIAFAFTLTPMLSSVFLHVRDEKESLIVKGANRVYRPIFSAAVKRPIPFALGVLLPVACACSAFFALGQEFMPPLEEGNLWIRVQLPGSISLEQSSKYVGHMRRIVRGCPEDDTAPCTQPLYPQVQTVVSAVGRPDDGTDPAGFNNIEIFAPLAPFDKWPRGVTKAMLVDELSGKLQSAFPGASISFSQAIRDNVMEAISGVKGENSIKVYGPDVRANEANAQAVSEILRGVHGVRDVGTLRSIEQPTIKIEPDRTACARFGLNTGDVVDVIQAAVGGQAVTQVFEGEKRFDVVVRWLEPYRASIEAIGEITVRTKNGASVPLAQIASIDVSGGPSVIYREDGTRFSAVRFSVRGRDLASTIQEARARVDAGVHLPYGSHLEWEGEIDELNDAIARLRVVVPLTLAAIVLLVHIAVKRVKDTIAVLFNLPVAFAGGVLALFLSRIHFSVSAAMGMVSILGIAVQDGILIVTDFRRRRVHGADATRAALGSARGRLRASLMTSLVPLVGLLPAAISHGIGSETQKPLALVVIGGCLSIAVLSRVLQPPLLVLLDRIGTKEQAPVSLGEPEPLPVSIPPSRF